MMDKKRCRLLQLNVVVIAAVLLTLTTVHSQDLSLQQITGLLPTDQELQGFSRTRPNAVVTNIDVASLKRLFTGRPVPDDVRTNTRATNWAPQWRPLSKQNANYSLVERHFFSVNSIYELNVVVIVCDSAETAQQEITTKRHDSQALFSAANFDGGAMPVDEAWAYNDATWPTLLCRYGRLVISVHGSPSFVAKSNGSHGNFPAGAIEAVVYQIILRASRQTSLTNVPPMTTRLTVNGRTLSGNPLLVGKQVYVPVREFAKAMGLQSQWNSETGTLTLGGPQQQAITVTAASTDAKVGQTSVTLKTPVLKEANQPVMALDDLLTLVKGKIISRKGNTMEVKT